MKKIRPYKSLFEKEIKEADDGECPPSGCVKKVGNSWRVISNKTGKLWPQTYDSEQDAKDAISAYHVYH